jgi:hypothetical protein
LEANLRFDRLTAFAAIFVSALSLFGGTASVRAEVYSYTGDPFTLTTNNTSVPGSYTTSMFVTGSFTTSAPLPANMPLTTIFGPSVPLGTTVTDFSFNDGQADSAHTRTPANTLASASSIRVSTGPSGEITGWSIRLRNYANFSDVGVGNLAFDIQSSNLVGDGVATYLCTATQCGPTAPPNDQAANLTPGQWVSAPAPVPLPAPLFLLAAAVAGLGVASRLRKRA